MLVICYLVTLHLQYMMTVSTIIVVITLWPWHEKLQMCVNTEIQQAKKNVVNQS